MKTIAITMDEDDLNRIDKVTASTEGVKNRSQFIRQAVRDYLARIEKAAEEEREREIFRRNRHRLHQQALALIKEQAKPGTAARSIGRGRNCPSVTTSLDSTLSSRAISFRDQL